MIKRAVGKYVTPFATFRIRSGLTSKRENENKKLLNENKKLLNENKKLLNENKKLLNVN